MMQIKAVQTAATSNSAAEKRPLLAPRIAVCLAAFNGIRFIEEQIQTILQQENVDVRLFISVDESTDDTLGLCRIIAAENASVILLPYVGRFGGAAKNFFRLIRDVDFSGFDYVSLADQDDVWLLDKLWVAHECLMFGGFSAYSGNVTAFWPDGSQLLINKAQSQRKYDFLFEAAGPGCTYVLKVAEALVLKTFLEKNWVAANEVSLHDWLLYAWFRANALQWYIDKIPKVLYRQHSSNQVGANKGVKAMWGRLKLLGSGWYRNEIGKIASLVYLSTDNMPPAIRRDGAVSRRFLLANASEVRRRLRDRFFFFVLVMVGLY